MMQWSPNQNTPLLIFSSRFELAEWVPAYTIRPDIHGHADSRVSDRKTRKDIICGAAYSIKNIQWCSGSSYIVF